jgi:anti-sigma factor RsiW
VKPPDPVREPTRDQLLAMAYVDGELAEAERRAFEARLAREPALGHEIAEYQGLALLARQMAPKEPADYEWDRLRLDLAQKSGALVAWILIAAGTTGLFGWAVVAVVSADDLGLAAKALIGALLFGLLLLFLLVLRARLRLLPHDPYTKVLR